jgi:hypothetical protein
MQLSDQQRAEIEKRLARCRELLEGFPEGVNAEHLWELQAELLNRLHQDSNGRARAI